MGYNHEELKEILAGYGFASFIDSLQSFLRFDGCVSFKNYDEVFIQRMEPGGQYRNRRIDIVSFLSASNNPKTAKLSDKESYSIAFEVKASKKNLLNDEKYSAYKGVTDFFFFAVPVNLIRETLDKVSRQDDVGVVEILSGTIIKMPCRQKLVPFLYYELLRQIAYCQSPYFGNIDEPTLSPNIAVIKEFLKKNFQIKSFSS